MDESLKCLNCGKIACEFPERGKPDFCAQDTYDEAASAEVRAEYASSEVFDIMNAAALVSDNTRFSTRVEDTLKFAKLIGARKIGIATCTAMLNESRILGGLLERAGFEVEGIGCKVDSNTRSDLGLDDPNGNDKVLCNPLMQARLLNRAKTDLNVVMGLCVGHDALFSKYSDAPVTTLVTKDFITGNNPCVALYASKGLFKRRLDETIDSLDDLAGLLGK
ncbi:MAG: DUF1847 domain-containing protein [Eggerthellaceae bacterium]|jgi:uncharacterized metal-binding protein|nr:DUF1847 domain-containing protein [Eggerthellaceae bacterium]